jgi:hypothetical protein
VLERPDLPGRGGAAFDLGAGDGVVRPRFGAGVRFGALRREARLEEMLDRVVPADRRRDADKAGDNRADRQRHQRIRHRRGRFVRTVPRAVTVAAAVIVVRRGVTVRIVGAVAVGIMRVVRTVHVRRTMADFVLTKIGLAVRVRIGGMLHAVSRRHRCRPVPRRCSGRR